MLNSRIFTVRTLTAFSPRYSSRISSVFSPKVRAFPFKVAPEDALIHMAPRTSAACFFKNFVGSLGARYLPGFGFKPFLPVKLTPVYFPGWIIDAEAEMNFCVENSQYVFTAVVHNSYLPGCDFRNLSLVSFSPLELGHDLGLVPLTEDLEIQFGEKIAFLPYTISPFSVLELARSFGGNGIAIADADADLRILPSTLKTNMLAAYPVLFPLYLARYEYSIPGTNESQNSTVFMEAWAPKGHIIMEAFAHRSGAKIRELLPDAPRIVEFFTHIMDGVSNIFLRGAPRSFLLAASSSFLAKAIANWSDNLLAQPSSPGTLASKSNMLDLENDLRIRPYSTEERIANQKWMVMSKEIGDLKFTMDNMQRAKGNIRTHTTTTNTGSIDQKEPLGNLLKNLEDQIKKLEAKRNDSIPAWWKEWVEKTDKKSN